MDILIDISVIVSDFVLGIFSGDEWKKIVKIIKKSE